MTNVPKMSACPLRTANLVQLRNAVGDCIEAISQLDMARESGGVVSDDVMQRLRSLLAEPAHGPSQGGC